MLIQKLAYRLDNALIAVYSYTFLIKLIIAMLQTLLDMVTLNLREINNHVLCKSIIFRNSWMSVWLAGMVMNKSKPSVHKKNSCLRV
jgi:hypothetical protein